MNFNYPLRAIFKSDIAKITKNLLPNDFTTADERTIRVASDVVISILDEMGTASAKAQDLQNPTTSWAELKNSDHTVYLLLDREEDIDGNGSVIGFLKIGWQKLNVSDLEGECHERNALCVLDFYVHESRQRSGWGKKLFEHMLKEENVSPETLAIDRPSHKFLLFLQKHYGLSDVVPQSNNFVVFTGFFSKADRDCNDSVTNIPKEQLAAGFSQSDYSTGGERHDLHGTGRHTAYKRESTMGQIISNQTSTN